MIVTTPCIGLVVCLLTQLGVPGSPWYHKRMARHVCERMESNCVAPELTTYLAFAWHESRLRHIKKPSKTWDYGLFQLHCPPWNMKHRWPCLCDVRKLKCNIAMGMSFIGALRHNHSPYNCHQKSKPDQYLYWAQYYNYHSKGYYMRVTRIKRQLDILAKVKCERHEKAFQARAN